MAGGVDRPDDWMPVFPSQIGGTARPSASAPSPCVARQTSPECSDDEGVTSGSLTSRCSPKSVYAVVSRFSEYKKAMVEEIGFGGMLHVPRITKVNLKFSKWLLSRFDPDRKVLVLRELHQIFSHENDVGTVFGTPSGEYDVLGPHAEICKEDVEFLRSVLGISGMNFKGVESILDEELDESSSRQQVNRFKIAFVIFVMGHLLKPSAKHDHANIDYWGALKNVDLIEKFNWSKYIFNHICESARRVRDELAKKGTISSLSGCHLFLQILFLDNVYIPRLNKPHNNIPRIMDFDSSTLNKMISAVADRDGLSYTCFTMLRATTESAYMRYDLQSPYKISYTKDKNLPTPKLKNLEVTPQVKILEGTPVVAPVELMHKNMPSTITPDTYTFSKPYDFFMYLKQKYPHLVACPVFDKLKQHNALMFQQMNRITSDMMKNNAKLADWIVQCVGADQLLPIQKAAHSTGTPTTAHITPEPSTAASSNTASCPEPFHEGFCATKRAKIAAAPDPPSFELCNFDPTPEKACSAPATSMGVGSPIRPACLFVTPHAQNQRVHSPQSATRSHAEGTVLCLITAANEDTSLVGKVLYNSTIDIEFQKMHFEAGPHSEPFCTTVVRSLFPSKDVVEMLHVWISDAAVECIEKSWIIHELPQYIQCSGLVLKNMFTGHVAIEHYVLDIIMRRLNQIDAKFVRDNTNMRWRYFMETDFAMLCIGGFHPEIQQSIMNQFVQDAVCLPRCQMLIFPILVDDCWCAYMWDLKRKVVHVLDPCLDSPRKGSHKCFTSIIKESINKCFATFFDPCPPLIDDLPLNFPALALDSMSKEDSGICMTHLARYYNGEFIDIPFFKEDVDPTRRSLLAEMLMIENNVGDLPAPAAKILQ